MSRRKKITIRNYYIEIATRRWSVVRGRNQRSVREAMMQEHARGDVKIVRRATDEEAAEYKRVGGMEIEEVSW